jgi:catechol 2,3-dioxygenase-like lactoylglutathione lyase family enzyme
VCAAATLDHVTITASDFERSLHFYDAALAALGLVRLRELVDEEEDGAAVEAAAWGAEPRNSAPGDRDHATVWLVTGERATNGLHIQLRANSRQDVEAFFSGACAAGGAGYLAPRRWTPYRRGEFQAIVCDPDGNLIEACAAE